MHMYPWFEVEDPEDEGDEPWDFDADELAFISALQDREHRKSSPRAAPSGSRPCSAGLSPARSSARSSRRR
ncbi:MULTISPECIES: hypothetical protein [unclassified Streptomyces]|uniref:hypothetical protein n=1 Tax=unclassified Streptomyces TaxID=2593676 RepID=UPI00136A97FF|nr:MULTISPECIES: hypothetical protein [unclassified Streptomyces]NEA01828.1 hypothetical protein [Streptomyces sp. SID10116]MYY83679.1 hypothetical protein [Streptomyces sp. SID335]MYZ16723.1 hypothetical protein [Streptomyces sp. SID337]NDZ87143.1 hypothetical protein [Streptomyces sp. SID10115]NEB45970.1 hypothetical protein [Streptomyces sp. SID339]